MKRFETKRVVLTEKTLKSTNQIKNFLECELVNCSIYELKYRLGIAFFYVNGDDVFVEIQFNNNRTEFLFDENIFKGFKNKKEEIQPKLNKIILKDFFQIEDCNLYQDAFLSKCSNIEFVLKNSNKIE